jgi:hypothetical protein
MFLCGGHTESTEAASLPAFRAKQESERAVRWRSPPECGDDSDPGQNFISRLADQRR